VLGYGPHSSPTPPTRSAFPALRCAVCSASCAGARTCAPSLVMRCGPNPRGILMAVHGCTARYVTFMPPHMGLGKAQLLQHCLSLQSSGQDAAGEHRHQLPRQGSQGCAQNSSSCRPFFTYLCYVKALARSTLRVSAENAADISRLVRICAFSPSPSYISHFPSAPFPGPNVFHTVRFKVIADDGTVILIPCGASPVDNEPHAS